MRDRLSSPHFVEQAGQICATLRSLMKGQEAVSRRHRTGTRQQEVLDVIEFEHVSLWPCCSALALVMVQVTPRTALSPNGRPVLLHLVEHVAEGRLELERLLDFIGAHIGILAVFQEARTLMLPKEP